MLFAMPKSPSQSVPYEPAAPISEEEQAANAASAWSTKLVITLAIIAITVTFLLCMIGSHIPGGE